MTLPTRPFWTAGQRVHRFFKTKPPHLCEVYGVYYSGHSASLPASAELEPLHCIRGGPGQCPYFRPHGLVYSSMLCMPGLCGVAPKSCAANQCCKPTCTRKRVIDPSRPSQDASSSTQSFVWNGSHNRTSHMENKLTAHHVIPSHIPNSIRVPQVHVSHASDCSNGPTEYWLWPLLMLLCPQPTQRLKRGVHRCRVRGCRSMKKATRACISHGACMQGALHPFTAKPLQTTTTKSHPSSRASVRRHPSKHVSPAESDLEASVCRMGGTRLLHHTPHHADRPPISHDCRGPPPSN
jgi:hypothetical protein